MSKSEIKNSDGAWIMGRVAMMVSLLLAHVWGTALVYAVVVSGKEGQIIADMFSAVGFMIFSTLGILVGGKGWKDFAQLRYGGATVAPTPKGK